ncbi:response regulator transcription factor [Paenibacillus camerounensis]|uniref:response regulator transcription factor n=1 Tax=Paenibacillus camerounensis TaxID=1243663 RepID=UPI000693687D|nr:response regulator transcription factor [Paenibacillus camerounensis]
MNEIVAWFTEDQSSADGGSTGGFLPQAEAHRQMEQLLSELGLHTVISEDPGDLRLLLDRVRPVLLLAEISNAGAWQGWNIISEYRSQGVFIPVMVIAGEGSGEEAVAVFEAGGNEYMMRPLHTGEFRCRVMNLLWLTGRRRGHESLIKIDGLMLDSGRRLVSRDGIQLSLTPKEFDLLHYLAVRHGEICPRDEILKHVWGYHFHADTNVVDVYIRHIRMKVDKGHRSKLIQTVRGTGYMLKAPESSPAGH